MMDNKDKPFSYFTNCVSIDRRDVKHLQQMIDDSRDITSKTFFKYVSRSDVESIFGYGKDFRISNDYHVRYYKSKFKGDICYYLVHSGIEYIYLKL